MTTQQTAPAAYLDALAEYVAETAYADIPESVRLHARYVLLDTVGAIISGSAEPENAALAASMASSAGAAAILNARFPNAAPADAALVNGTSGTAMEQDEGHPPVGHPAIYTIPALLALGEELRVDGPRLIEALVLAYEAYVRLGRSIRFAPGLHTHGSIAAVAAAIAAARIRGFDAPALREAVSIAACLSAATPFSTANQGATVRNVYAGLAGRTGLLAAQLAADGFTGPDDGLRLVYGSLLGDGVDADLIVHRLGEDFEIATNYFKLHAACRYTHAPLDALQRALGGEPVSPDDVAAVSVAGNANAAMCNRPDPQNMLAAKFSVPFAVATAIVHGHTKPDAFRQAAVDDPAVRALARRVAVSENPAYTARFPAEQIADVEVRLASGRVLAGSVNNPRGAERDPVSYDEVEAKFAILTASVFGERAAEAQRLFLNVDALPDLRQLTDGLRRLAR